MITRFFLCAGLMLFDIGNLAGSAGQTEAFVWAGLLAVTTPLFVLTAFDLQNDER